MGNYPINLMSVSIIILLIGFVTPPVYPFNFGREEQQTSVACSGYCTKDPHLCISRGGRVNGICSNALYCCNPLVRSTISCGDTSAGQRLIHFKSAGYPATLSGDLTCEAKIKLQPNTVSIRVDFVHVEMDGQSFRDIDDTAGSCESDMIFLKGFGSWTPPARCGNLSGYSFLIDKESRQVKEMHTLRIVALMSSRSYRWHIKVLQTPRRKHSADTDQNSIDEYEVPFKEKRSLLTPIFRLYDYDDEKDNGTVYFDDHDTLESRILTGQEDSTVSSRPDLDSTLSSRSDLYSTVLPSRPDLQLDSQQEFTSKPIVNGHDSVISSVPWQVSIRLKSDDTVANHSSQTGNETLRPVGGDGEESKNCSVSEGEHFCGGSIINDRFILSAAHCFYGTSKSRGMMNVSSMKVVVGDTNICSDDSVSSGAKSPSFDYDIESITLHYAYDGQLIVNDIAVLRLKSQIRTFDHIQPIRMAKKGDEYSGRDAVVSGWGEANLSNNTDGNYLDTLESPDILQAGKKFVIQNQTYCTGRDLELQYINTAQEIMRHTKYLSIFNSTLCTLSKVDKETEDRLVHVGQGDSGGPLVVYQNVTDGIELPILVGVVSYGIADDDDSISCSKKDSVNNTIEYFSSVPFYREWIDLTVSSYDNPHEQSGVFSL